jgi:uncharacterized protein YerC
MSPLSNLPPGCTSADGGIDHAFEQALDDLCNAIETAEEARLLLAVLRDMRTNANASATADRPKAVTPKGET